VLFPKMRASRKAAAIEAIEAEEFVMDAEAA
jgi:hypothetical protein